MITTTIILMFGFRYYLFYTCWAGLQPDNETVAVPDLYIVTVHKPFSLRYGLAIVATDQWFKSYEKPVNANRVRPVFLHWLQSKGRRSPLRSLATSGERN